MRTIKPSRVATVAFTIATCAASQPHTSESTFIAQLTHSITTHTFDSFSHRQPVQSLPGVRFVGAPEVWNEQGVPSGGAWHSAPNVLWNGGSPVITCTFSPPVHGVGLFNTSIADRERLEMFACDGRLLFSGELPEAHVNFLGFVATEPIACAVITPIAPTNGTIFIDTLSFGTTGPITTPCAQQQVELYGCTAPAGSLTLLGGTAALGETLLIGIDNPVSSQRAGAATALLVSATADPGFPCGTRIPGFGMMPGVPGELLISPATFITALTGPNWTGSAPAVVSLPVPIRCGLLGTQIYTQGVMVDLGTPSGVELALTDGLRVRVGV